MQTSFWDALFIVCKSPFVTHKDLFFRKTGRGNKGMGNFLYSRWVPGGSGLDDELVYLKDEAKFGSLMEMHLKLQTLNPDILVK